MELTEQHVGVPRPCVSDAALVKVNAAANDVATSPCLAKFAGTNVPLANTRAIDGVRVS